MTTINNLNQTYQSNYSVNSNSKIPEGLSFSIKSEQNVTDKHVTTVTAEDLRKMEADLAIKDLKMNYVKDKETGENIIQIKDDQNNVIRQIPPKEQLVIRKAIDDFLKNYDSTGKSSNISTGLLSIKS